MKRAWWQFGRREDELSEEIESHIAMAVRERVARGESLDSATAAARRQFGNREVVHATARDMWGFVWLEQLLLDLRYAIRKLRLAPGFALASTLSLAFGIGATVTMFAVVDTADIRSLPYPHADRLVAIEETATATAEGARGRVYEMGTSPEAVAAWRQATQSFDAIAFVNQGELYSAQDDENERLDMAEVDPDFFRVLSATPAVGRAVAPGDTAADAPGVIVLSDRFWRARFGADRGVVGRTLQVTRSVSLTAPRETFTIVGVMPPNVDYPGGTLGWMAYRPRRPGSAGTNGFGTAHVVARLRAGRTIEAARAELNALERGVAAASPVAVANRAARVKPLHEHLREPYPNDANGFDSAKGRAVRLAVVLVVLLIAVINVGNLLLARAAFRTHEFSVRTALGASRWRLARQILIESACISFLGASFGVAMALWGTAFVASLGDLKRMGIVPRIDIRVAIFAVVLGIGVALGIGVIPIVALVRTGGRRMRGAFAGATGRSGRAGVSGLLLTTQLAFALTLLTGAGLLTKELIRLRTRGYDYDPANIIYFPSNWMHGGSAARDQFRSDALSRIKAIPGVASASDFELCGCAGFFPLGDKKKIASFFISAVSVNPGFLKNLQTPAHRGRDFSDADFSAAAPVAIVSSSCRGHDSGRVKIQSGSRSSSRQDFRSVANRSPTHCI